MNPLLSEYIIRFQKDQTLKSIPTFFTQLDSQEYYKTLPYLFGIEVFCVRLLQALQQNHRICIYSDYDTDAVTATATMLEGLTLLGFDKDRISFYAPDRFTEGYGMNPEAIRELVKDFDLIISVDCGINSVAEADAVIEANQIAMSNSSSTPQRVTHNCDLIITDHHHLQDQVPNALSVINPRLAEFYNDNPEAFANQILKVIKSSSFENDLQSRITNWVNKVQRQPSEFPSNPELFLTSSATGVGVAWFCLVWLSYFLIEVSL